MDDVWQWFEQRRRLIRERLISLPPNEDTVFSRQSLERADARIDKVRLMLTRDVDRPLVNEAVVEIAILMGEGGLFGAEK